MTNISNETKKKVYQFSKEQSTYYLNDAEMTYLEKLRKKSNATKDKISNKVNKFKGTSMQSEEATNDMILYMSDYMNDLIANGMSEEEAFTKAKRDLSFESESQQAEKLQDKYVEYYQSISPNVYEAVGLYYAGSFIIFAVIGTIIGLLLAQYVLTKSFWAITLIGTGAGSLIGLAIGMLMHARTVQKISK